MKKQNPARISNSIFKKLLITQTKIAKMLKRSPFISARQLFPMKDLQFSVDNLGFDKYIKKIKILNLIRAIFYNVVIHAKTNSRHIGNTGKTMPGKIFSQLPPVSHVAILDRIKSYDEEKIDAFASQLLDGYAAGTNRSGKDTSKVKIIDSTSITFSFSRTSHELPASGKNKITKDGKKAAKGLLKLGIVVQAGSFMPIDWVFSVDHNDNQIFRDLVDWNDVGFTYLIDRGNIAVDYLLKFTTNRIYFIQKTFANHTFIVESKTKLPQITAVLNRYRAKFEYIGWITREDGTRVKVRRIVAHDLKTNEELSLTTNNFDTDHRQILKKHYRRWEIEVLNDWLKNTIGPNDTHSLTQWKNIDCFRNLIRIHFIILGVLLGYAMKKFGTKWWKPQIFSLGNVVAEYKAQLERWLEGKLGLRQRKGDLRL